MASYAISFNEQSSINIHPILKNCLSIVMGIGMTLALFFTMYSLIKNDALPDEPTEPIVIPPLNYEPPIIDIKFPEIEQPVKPVLVVPPTVVDTLEPIDTTIEPGLLKIPTIVEPTKGILPLIENNQILPMVKVNPTYPQADATRGIEGFVDVIFDVTETGSTKNIEVAYAEPERIFNSAVVKAVSRWKYKPKMEEGVAIPVVGVRERIRFNLDK